MNDTLMAILLVFLILVILGIALGVICATWNLFRHHSQLPVQEKRKKWFKDFWFTWLEIVLNIFEVFL